VSARRRRGGARTRLRALLIACTLVIAGALGVVAATQAASRPVSTARYRAFRSGRGEKSILSSVTSSVPASR
jgi:hypothetical protein